MYLNYFFNFTIFLIQKKKKNKLLKLCPIIIVVFADHSQIPVAQLVFILENSSKHLETHENHIFDHQNHFSICFISPF